MKRLLKKITSDPDCEARWLNTISLLEHIGARKISKTVAQTHPTLSILEHYADETRHAYAFKRLSLQLAEKGTNAYLCRNEAIDYFQGLDRQTDAWIQEHIGSEDHYANYLLTTSLIERRAMQLYPLYRDTTQHDEVRAELDKIIQEEANHRKAIDSKLRLVLNEYGYDLSELWPLEQKLFNRFALILESRLSKWDSLPTTYHPDPCPEISAE